MAKDNNASIEFFTTPFECRLLWPHLTKKRDKDVDGKPLAVDDQYYEATLVFPKTSPDPRQCQNYAYMSNMLMAIIAKQPGWNGQWPANGQWPIKDCDDPAFASRNEWARGHWRISPWSNYVIRAFDMGNNALPTDIHGDYRGIKSGDYCLASVNAFAWTYGNSKTGISFGIEAVKKTRDGDPVGGGQRSVEQMFGAPTGQPVQYGGAGATSAPPLPAGPPPAPVGNPHYDSQQPFIPGAAGGSPMSGGAPLHYAPNAAQTSPMAPAPNHAYAPPPPAGPGAYPSSPPAPQQAYAPPPGNPVAPPQNYGAPVPGPTYTPPAGPPIGTR